MYTSENICPNQDYLNASGPVAIPMTNDYLFRAMLQENNQVLKALIASLLHLEDDEVQSVIILNPIELGTSIASKNMILDIKVELNNSSIINLEMQVINEHNWPERSLTYLCRSFDSLNAGEDYIDVKAAYQISILDFTLFPDALEFYSTYHLMNIKTHRKYSDKLQLSVLDLNQINLATDMDRKYKIDYWASLFKAQTWEELKEMAKLTPDMEQAVSTVYKLTQEDIIRQQCEAREEFLRRQRTEVRARKIAEQKTAEVEQKLKNTEQQLVNTEQQLVNAEQMRDIADRKAQQLEQAYDQIASERDLMAAELARLRLLLEHTSE